jgi:hypothetical protein
MQICFFRAKFGNLLDRLIAWRTKSDYSHVEIRFSDGVWTTCDPLNGVVFRYIPYSEAWDVYDLKTSNKFMDLIKESMVRNWCEKEIGHPYDLVAIFGQAIGFNFIEDPIAWTCSEYCSFPLKKFGIIDIPEYRTSPKLLHEFISARFDKVNH